METEGSIVKLNEASNELGMTSQKSTLSNNRFTSRTRDISKPKYTNEQLDNALFDEKMLPFSDVRKNISQDAC